MNNPEIPGSWTEMKDTPLIHAQYLIKGKPQEGNPALCNSVDAQMITINWGVVTCEKCLEIKNTFIKPKGGKARRDE